MNRDVTARARFWVATLPLIGMLLLLGAQACREMGARPAPQRHVVEIRGFAYHPESLTVSAGDTVVWVNRDAVPHTATTADGEWDSGSIAGGDTWSRTFSGEGSGDYLCTFHPGMTGRLVIR